MDAYTTEEQRLFHLAEHGCDEALGQVLAIFCRQRNHRIAQRIPGEFRGQLDADDVLQQACVDAFVSFAGCKFKNLDAMRGWFDTISRRNLIDAVRSLRTHRRGGQMSATAVSTDSSFSSLFARLPIDTATASRIAIVGETLARLSDAIGRLPPHYREVIERYELNGEKIEAIASSLGRSVGSLFMIRSRALRTLGSMLESSTA